MNFLLGKEVDAQQLQTQRTLNLRRPDHAVVCCCLPLRTATFVNAMFTVVLSILLLFTRKFMDDNLRIFTGGYSLQGHVFVDLIEISGMLWGTIGIIGALYLKTSYVRIYFYYQMARLFAWFVMYSTDVPLLWNCELWMTDLKRAGQKYRWNATMYDIAVNSRCQEERMLFTTFSTISLMVFIYFIMATHMLLSDLEKAPKYLLRLPMNIQNGAFYTKSLAGRSERVEAEKRERAVDKPPTPSQAPAVMNSWVGQPAGPPSAPPMPPPALLPSMRGYGSQLDQSAETFRRAETHRRAETYRASSGSVPSFGTVSAAPGTFQAAPAAHYSGQLPFPQNSQLHTDNLGGTGP